MAISHSTNYTSLMSKAFIESLLKEYEKDLDNFYYIIVHAENKSSSRRDQGFISNILRSLRSIAYTIEYVPLGVSYCGHSYPLYPLYSNSDSYEYSFELNQDPYKSLRFLLYALHKNGHYQFLNLCEYYLNDNQYLKDRIKSFYNEATKPIMQLSTSSDINIFKMTFPSQIMRNKFIDQLGRKQFSLDHEYFPNQYSPIVSQDEPCGVSLHTYEKDKTRIIVFPDKEMCAKFTMLIRHINPNNIFIHENLIHLKAKSKYHFFRSNITICAEVSELKSSAYIDVRYVSRWLFVLQLYRADIKNLPYEIILLIAKSSSNTCILSEAEIYAAFKKNFGRPLVVEQYLNDGDHQRTKLTYDLLRRHLYETNQYSNDIDKLKEIGSIFSKILSIKNNIYDTSYRDDKDFLNIFSKKRNDKILKHINILQEMLIAIVKSSKESGVALLAVLQSEIISSLIDFKSSFKISKTTETRDKINKLFPELALQAKLI